MKKEKTASDNRADVSREEPAPPWSICLLGSLIQSMTYFAAYVGHGKFSKRWILWYVLRPFIGVPLALLFYFVLRGGFFSVSAGSEAVNPYGVAALSGLAGMFSKQAMEKLKTTFDSIFKTGKAKK